ncbi:MAG: aspartyl beta-hydroxylase [Thomasclavelia sp.]|jgi:polyhydroxyalkanoate synthesis regulator phasin|nr:aspartyl beta-hydroxylase [Thomasclavelia sp.]
MLDDLSEDLKKILLVGIGAAAVTVDKSKDVIDELVKKGNLTVEAGKQLNEELKHNKDVQHVENIKSDLSKLSKEDLKAIKDAIASLEDESTSE